eukprot:gene2094-2581_t
MQTINRKRLIQWSPHETNSFIVGSSDIRLYGIKYKNTNSNNNNNSNGNNNTNSNNFTENHNVDIFYPPDGWVKKDKKTVDLISINSEIQFMKCMTWCLDATDPNLIACGLTTGRAMLTSFSSVNRILKEFVPKHTRPCNAITWNPFFKNQLAVGLDKVRGDSSTLIWDINYVNTLNLPPPKLQQHTKGIVDAPYTVSQISDNSFNIAPIDSTDTIYHPISDFTLSEATLSLAWIPKSPTCLIVGTGSKWLKIYDTRDSNNVGQSVAAHNKSVNGVCVDPFDNNRLATISEDSYVKIWDIRKFDDPVMTLNTNYKSVQQIEWCPTRSGVLACTGKEKNSVKLWDIKSPVELTKSPRNDRKATSDSVILTSSKPTKTHYSSEIISSFSWHPTNECRMLTVSYSGVIEVVSLNENIPVSWSPQGSLCFSLGKNLLEGPSKGTTIEPDLKSDTNKNLINDGRYEKDISLIMKERAMFGYSANIDDNVNLARKINNNDINFLWSWIQKISVQMSTHKKKMLIKPNDDKSDQKDSNDYPGIYHIVYEKDGYFSNPSVETMNGFLVYKSQNRFLCSTICGWGFLQNYQLEAMILSLEKQGDFERAAAIAIFHLDIKRAMQTLQNGCTLPLVVSKDREQTFRVTSIALAGFGDGTNNQIWKETCRSMSKNLNNPYLKTSLEFLISNSDPKEILSVIEDSQIILADKIALSSRYLNQNELINFIERSTNQVIENGNLQGILLTGLTPKGIELLQNYIDNTGDIQTACLAISVVVPKIFRDKKVSKWFSIYSDLLDNWELWHERALLDIQRISANEPLPQTHIFAKCGYCQNSFSFDSISSGSMAGRNARPTSKVKVPCCPHCKQSLPRCSLCLLPLNCVVPGLDYKKPNHGEVWTAGAESFDDWFTWCQTCRHGGHAQHLLDWFKDHTVCPVTDCTCKCNTI